MAWKVLIPLALANLLCAMIIKEMGWSPWWLTLASILLLLTAGWAAVSRPPTPPRARIAVGGTP